MAKGADIEERLIDFAVRNVRLNAAMPNTVPGRHIAGQLVRSGTAPAAHYAEARGAESTKNVVLHHSPSPAHHPPSTGVQS